MFITASPHVLTALWKWYEASTLGSCSLCKPKDTPNSFSSMRFVPLHRNILCHCLTGLEVASGGVDPPCNGVKLLYHYSSGREILSSSFSTLIITWTVQSAIDFSGSYVPFIAWELQLRSLNRSYHSPHRVNNPRFTLNRCVFHFPSSYSVSFTLIKTQPTLKRWMRDNKMEFSKRAISVNRR